MLLPFEDRVRLAARCAVDVVHQASRAHGVCTPGDWEALDLLGQRYFKDAARFLLRGDAVRARWSWQEALNAPGVPSEPIFRLFCAVVRAVDAVEGGA